MVIYDIACTFLCGELQAVGFDEPLVACFLVTMHQAVVIVDIRAWLCDFSQFNKPMATVEGSHLIL